MKFLKDKKYKFLIIFSIAGIVLIIFFAVAINTVVELFSPPEKAKMTDNIKFNLDYMTEETKPIYRSELEEKSAIYEDNTSKGVNNKSISFKIKQSSPPNQQTNNQKVNPTVKSQDLAATLLQVSSKPQPIKKKQNPQMEEQIKSLYYPSATPQQLPPQPSPVQQQETELQKRKRELEQGFNTNNHQTNQNQSPIHAVIHGTQTITTRGQLILRTISEGYTDNNVLIPKNTIIYGEIKHSDIRLQINFSSIYINGNIHPFSYTLYALDGRIGIFLNKESGEVNKAIKSNAENQVTKFVNTNPIGAIATSIGKEIITAVERGKRIEITLVDNQKFQLVKL